MQVSLRAWKKRAVSPPGTVTRSRAPRAQDRIERTRRLPYRGAVIQPDQLVGPEWAEWYCLSPSERWLESGRLLAAFLMLGGSLDPEPDTQSPFFDSRAPRPSPADGRSGVRIVRRGGV
jgi:hypothetical protein